MDNAGNVYVTDSAHDRVLKLAAGAKTQTVLLTGITYPAGVAVDAAGNVYVLDNGTKHVLKLPAQ